MIETALPADVLAAIGPAVEAIAAETRTAVDTVEHARLSRMAMAAARENGGGGYSYGAVKIIETAFPSLPAPVTVDRNCQCESCDDEECDGSCDSCEESYDCPQHGCEYANDCCGYCSDCESHHGDDANRVFSVQIYSGGTQRTYTVCPECQHACEEC